MEVEQDVRVSRSRQDVTLDATLRADEQQLETWPQPDESARDCQRRIQVAAGAAAGKDHQHLRRDRKRVRSAASDHAFATTPDVHQDAGHHEREQEVGPTVRHERQREPCRRKEADDDTNVDERRDDRGYRQPDRDQLQERTPRLSRDAHAEPRVTGEQTHEEHHAEKAPLLADSAGNEIVVAERHEPELLSSLPKALAEETARTNRNE